MAVFKSKTATKDGRKWYFSACYTKPSGERDRKKSGKFYTKLEAQEAERQFLIEIKDIKVHITFEEMYYQYLSYTEDSIKGSTKHCKNNRMKNHILNYFGKFNIHDIDTRSILSWKSLINDSTKNYALSYKRTLFKELRVVLGYGVDFCGLTENVASKIGNFSDKSEQVITDEEKIKYIIPDEYNLFTSVIENIVFKAFFAFLYYMGVRKGEAQALTWNDINWNTRKVSINKTITNKTYEIDENGFRFKITNTKNRKNRKIGMPEELYDLMVDLYEYYRTFEGFNNNWFVFGGSKHLSSTTIDTKKDYYFEQVKNVYGKIINRITNHGFRHSHASYLISSGVRIELIAKRLGDTVEIVSEIYAHLFPESEDELIEALDSIKRIGSVNEPTKKEFYKPPSFENSLYC